MYNLFCFFNWYFKDRTQYKQIE